MKKSNILKIVLSSLLTAFLFYSFFTLISPQQITQTLIQAQPLSLIFASSFFLLAFAFNALRWSSILKINHANPSFFSLVKIIFMSMMLNNLIPLRIGEISKSFFLIKNLHIKPSLAIITVFTERLFDLFVIILFLSLPLALPGYPLHTLQNTFSMIVQYLTQLYPQFQFLSQLSFSSLFLFPLSLLIVTLFALALVLLLFKKYPNQTLSLSQKILFFLPKNHQFFAAFQNSLQILLFLHQPKKLIPIFSFSFLTWFSYAISFFFFLKAFQVPLQPIFSLFVIGSTALGLSIPGTPAGFGPFEISFTLSSLLSLGDTWKNYVIPTSSAAFMTHIFQIVLSSSIGIFFFFRQRFNIKDILNQKK